MGDFNLHEVKVAPNTLRWRTDYDPTCVFTENAANVNLDILAAILFFWSQNWPHSFKGGAESSHAPKAPPLPCHVNI